MTREPLFHFLLLGGLLYGLYAAAAPPDPGSRSIVVDRPALLEYLQYRYKRFDPKGAGLTLDRMPPEEFKELVSDFVQQEVLYREAVKYGLDRDDDVIKQRMIQKSRFILEGQDAAEPTNSELRAYYKAHIGQFTEPARLTLTHVFFDEQLHAQKTEALARAAVKDLNARRSGFSDVRTIGDRFPYLVNYVERPLDYVAEHFGDEFARKAERGSKVGGFWQGPWHSNYGWHAVMLTERKPPEPIPFAEAENEVRSSLQEERLWNRRRKALADVIESYQVKVDIDRPQQTSSAG